ncbi:MAG: hypothetical protein WD874_01410, partial [Parcubacteria group bacterium]
LKVHLQLLLKRLLRPKLIKRPGISLVFLFICLNHLHCYNAGGLTTEVKMPASLNKGMPNIDSMPPIPGQLWRVAGQYGFNTIKKSRLRNEAIRVEFSARIHAFLSHLDSMAENECTWRTLDVILRVDRSPLGPFERKKVVSVEWINILTIVWACALIRLGYRGIIRPGILDLLKNEVIWFLSSMKYKLPVHHVLFCPFLTEWEKVKDWNVLESNETRTKSFPGQSVAPKPLSDVCVECIASTKAAHS